MAENASLGGNGPFSAKIALTDNAKFPNPTPTLVAFAALITALVNAINAYNSAIDAEKTALTPRD